MFLQFGSEELDNHLILPKWYLSSDHTSFTITILIFEEYIQNKKRMIVKNSDEEKTFVNNLVKAIKLINISNLLNVKLLKNIVLSFARSIERIWEENLKMVNITKHSKSWWNINCSRDLENYKSTKHIEDWKQFKKTVKNTKCLFFDLKIQEISNKRWGPWKLINWVNKHKLPAIEAVKFNNHPCLKIEDLWYALHLLFNIAQNCQVNMEVLNEIPSKCFLS